MKRAPAQPVLAGALLEGEHARLRPVRPADAEAIFPMIHRRREVLEWLVWQGPRDVRELREAYARWILPSESGHNYHLAIEDRERECVAGTIVLRFAGHPFVGDLGYWLGSEHWGRGLGSEAVALVARLGFRHLEARELVAEVFVGNLASARVLEKNAFERDARLSRLRLPGGGEREEWVFRLARAHWAEGGAAQRAPRVEEIELEAAPRAR